MNTIVLAGGNNCRIQMNKALARIGGKTIIETIIGKLSPLFQRIIIVTNSKQEYEYLKKISPQVDLTSDIIAGKGPLGGIYSGLCGSDSQYNFVIGCDMPFLNTSLIQYMIENLGEYDVVVPKVGDLLEPLYAIYSKECIKSIKKQLDLSNLSLRALFRDVRVKFIEDTEIEKFDQNHIAFFNINDAEDLEEAGRIADEI